MHRRKSRCIRVPSNLCRRPRGKFFEATISSSSNDLGEISRVSASDDHPGGHSSRVSSRIYGVSILMLKLKRRKEVEGAYGGRPLRSKSAIDVRSAVVFVDF